MSKPVSRPFTRHRLPTDPLDPYGCNGQMTPMQIYKIFHAHEWASLCQNGQTNGAPIDLADGYIHFSTAVQVAETAAKHFSGATDLVLCAVETAGETGGLGDDLRWEISRGGADFPHLYRALKLRDVIWARDMPLVNGTHVLPAGVV